MIHKTSCWFVFKRPRPVFLKINLLKCEHTQCPLQTAEIGNESWRQPIRLPTSEKWSGAHLTTARIVIIDTNSYLGLIHAQNLKLQSLQRQRIMENTSEVQHVHNSTLYLCSGFVIKYPLNTLPTRNLLKLVSSLKPLVGTAQHRINHPILKTSD